MSDRTCPVCGRGDLVDVGLPQRRRVSHLDCVLTVWDEAHKQVQQAEAELAKWQQAVGLASTCVPTMEIDITDPIGMMQQVCAKVAKLEAEVQRLEKLVDQRDDLADALADWPMAADLAGVPDELEQSPVDAFGFVVKRAEQAEAERDELVGMADAFDGLAFDAMRFAVEPTDENRDALLMWKFDEGGTSYRSLKAEVARMKRLYEIDMRRAEAEVERLNRQRCATCALMTYMECPVWPAIHRAGFTPPPDDFACNRWEARHE